MKNLEKGYDKTTSLGGGNSKIFYFSPLFGEDFQFDKIFFKGVENHQLVKY